MIAESIALLVILLVGMNVVMKGPAATWLSDEMANIIRLPRPETHHAAMITMPMPLGGVYPAVSPKGSREFIANAAGPLRMVMVSRQFKPDLGEHASLLNATSEPGGTAGSTQSASRPRK